MLISFASQFHKTKKPLDPKLYPEGHPYRTQGSIRKVGVTNPDGSPYKHDPVFPQQGDTASKSSAQQQGQSLFPKLFQFA